MPRFTLGLVIDAADYAEAQKVRASAMSLFWDAHPNSVVDIKPPEPTRDMIEVYTDGGCGYRRTSIGAWAYVMVGPDGKVTEATGTDPETTNNRMEMMAVISALQALPNDAEAVIYADSEYVIKGVTVWCRNWLRNGWKNSAGNDVINRDLWEVLIPLFKAHTAVTFKHVRGHTGVPMNERCDQLCTSAMTNLHREMLPEGGS